MDAAILKLPPSFFLRYMNEEGWAPAVFLKRVGVATGNSPAILKRLPITSMQLRDKASDPEESLKTTLQGEKCSRKLHVIYIKLPFS